MAKTTADNRDVQPWAPDPDHAPGELGERGSSAFPGSDGFEAYDAEGRNVGATKATGSVAGDAPTVHSNPEAEPFVYRGSKGDTQHARERAAERSAVADS